MRLCVRDIGLQLDRQARQDNPGHQGHPDWQADDLVLPDSLDGLVLQAIQVHLEDRALWEIQVIMR